MKQNNYSELEIKNIRERSRRIEWLTIDDYFYSLDSGFIDNKEDELYVRTKILYAYNDRIRFKNYEQPPDITNITMPKYIYEKIKYYFDHSKIFAWVMILKRKGILKSGMFKHNAEKEKWEQNVKRLIELLDSNNTDQLITIAELHRNLGDFAKCEEIISGIVNPEYDWLKQAFLKKCKEKDILLFELDMNHT